MSQIIIPTDEKELNKENGEQELVCTEEDEMKFLLMYHMHIQPSELDNMPPERMKLILAQFFSTKQMEKEQYQNAMLARKLQAEGAFGK